MDRASFWVIIGEPTGSLDQRVTRLERRLAQLPVEQIYRFADRLAEALQALNTPEHAVATNAMGDAFLYLRCAAVLSGEVSYKQILANPSVFADLAGADAEPLLYAAGNAYERATGLAWEYRSPVDFESGSNAAGDEGVNLRPDESYVDSLWLLYSTGNALFEMPAPEYELATVAIMDKLNASADWRNWWHSSKSRKLEASLILDPRQPESVKIKKGRDVIHAEICRHRFGYSTPPGSPPAHQARDDIETVLRLIGDKLHLAEPPTFPPLPALSDEELRLQRDAQQRAASTQQDIDAWLKQLGHEPPT